MTRCLDILRQPWGPAGEDVGVDFRHGPGFSRPGGRSRSGGALENELPIPSTAETQVTTLPRKVLERGGKAPAEAPNIWNPCDWCPNLRGIDGPYFDWPSPFHTPKTEITSASRNVVYMYAANGELSCIISKDEEGHATFSRKNSMEGSRGRPPPDIDILDQEKCQGTSQLWGYLSPGVTSALGSTTSTSLEHIALETLRPENSSIPPPSGTSIPYGKFE